MQTSNKDLRLFFPTPIWSSVIGDYQNINKVLFQYIKDLQKQDPQGTAKSNFLGWHSKDFVLDDNSIKNFVETILPKIKNAIEDMGWDKDKNKIKITSIWSIINTKNASNSRHIHANNYISAAYYVKAPKNCGNIIFYDPREAKTIRKPASNISNNLNAEIVSIVPEEGLLVLFPSYLHHSVNQNTTDEERIVISFNIDLFQ